jgi:hypothetical protein
MNKEIMLNGVIRQAHYKLATEVQLACRQADQGSSARNPKNKT